MNNQERGGATQGLVGANQGSGGATQGSCGVNQGSGGANQGSGGATQDSVGANQGSGGANQGSGGATQGSVGGTQDSVTDEVNINVSEGVSGITLKETVDEVEKAIDEILQGGYVEGNVEVNQAGAIEDEGNVQISQVEVNQVGANEDEIEQGYRKSLCSEQVTFITYYSQIKYKKSIVANRTLLPSDVNLESKVEFISFISCLFSVGNFVEQLDLVWQMWLFAV
ncbi:hypothetical protein L1887_24139 [Cichorium endivia]|nr:hypothetical protein L1887_24139 [Cichorium endivia]